MSVITSASHPKALWPGVKRWWGLEYKKHSPIWPLMFTKLTSDKAYEEDVETIGFGLLSRKDQNGGIVYDTATQGTVSRYNHITYGLGYQVTLEELRDNQYEKVSFKRTTRLARSVYETEEVIHANVFNRAFNSSFTGGDGKEMIATNHPCANGDQSNELTIAADMSEASLEDLTIQIMDAVDSRGLKFSNKPKALYVPNALTYEAHRIVKSVLQNDTANNAPNVLKMLNVFPGGIVTNPYFTDSDAYFISTDCDDGLTHYTSWEAEFDKDNDFETKNLKASVTIRFSCGWTNFRSIYGSAGA